MEGDESFVALVHHDGMIRYKTREGVKFTDKSSTNVFMTSRTTLLDMQRSIIRKFGLDGRKRVSIYYQIQIFIVAQGVKYGCFSVEEDNDLQILFHCRRQFPEVRTTELFVDIADPLASSGVSAPNPRPVNVGGVSSSRIQCDTDVLQVASPSFDFNLQAEAATRGNELGDSRSFGELGVAMAATPQSISPPTFEGVPDPDPHVGEALRPDNSDEESEFIEEDNDDEASPVAPPQGGGTPNMVVNHEKVTVHGFAASGGGITPKISTNHSQQGFLVPSGINVSNSERQPVTGSLSMSNPN
ncbi:hypothetical protein PIB30_009007 [Stylosanthes scabra]|uniref:PID domain-containing protein n=1 Tax=Stylosanthes scabra TaxID=79078 RepID=A0ABU6T6X3_9FABA|nr:hypothetical protein [Stylosanthes scabra]